MKHEITINFEIYLKFKTDKSLNEKRKGGTEGRNQRKE